MSLTPEPSAAPEGEPSAAPEGEPSAELSAELERPRELYRARLAEREREFVALEHQDARFSRARVGCFISFLALTFAGWQLGWAYWILLLPMLAFVVLASLHERVLAARDRAGRAVAHYRDGLERLADGWAGKGTTATDYLEGEHPYAADLDLFGVGSLFDLVCRARTRAGEERLATWLCVHAERRVEVEVIRARQASVMALLDATALREDLAVLGSAARFEVRPAALIEWGRAPALFPAKVSRWLPAAGMLLPPLAVAGALAWGLGYGPYLLVGVALIEGAIYRGVGPILERVMGIIDRQGRELSVLAALLQRVERGEIEDPRLAELAQGLGAGGERDGQRASEAIAQLHRLAGWYEAQRNGLFFPVALLLMWGPNFALAIERWRHVQGPRIAAWIDALAELEALSSLAGYAFENPDARFPELVEVDAEDAPCIEGEGLGHPLLSRESCVRNDLSLVAPVRAHVISGSNMSGKSTFLRTVGINVVLALAGAPVRAMSMRVSPVRIGATLRVQDSLQEGASRFWAELVRLRVVSELAQEGPTLFLLDEIFHGTNSHDRRIGAEALLNKLLEHGAIGLLTTHDLALAQAAEALAPAATNVHFEDQLRDGELCFDYRMREGVVRKSNALALMRSVGLDL